MNYEIDLSVHQAAVPLLRVADVIATYTATLGGTIPRLEPTYIESYERNLSWLLDEVRLGDLKVCNERGKVITFGKYGDEITFYSSTIKQLNAWGDGDYFFTAVDMPLEVITFDIKDENGNVAHYDGFVASNKAPLKISILPMVDVQEAQHPASSLSTKGEPKKVIQRVFAGMHFDYAQWGSNLADVPNWLIPCRVSRGSKGKRVSHTWNPVLIGLALMDKGITKKQLNLAFMNLKDWSAEWQEITDSMS